MTTSFQDKIEAVRKAFDFHVGTYNLSGPDGVKTDMYGVFRTDTWDQVADKSVKKNYTPHTSDDVCALVEAGQEVFEGNFDVSCGFNKGHYVSIAPSTAERKRIINTNDNIFPRMLINASYNGNSFRVTIGYYRDLCNNMAMMESVANCSVSIRHTSGLREKMGKLIQNYQTLKNGWDNLTQFIDRMNSQTVDPRQFIREIYGDRPTEEGRGATMYDKRLIHLANRMLDERKTMDKEDRSKPIQDFMMEIYGQGKELPVWELYNAVQGYSQHDKTRKGNGNNDFRRMIMATEDTDVKAAEKYALSLVA